MKGLIFILLAAIGIYVGYALLVPFFMVFMVCLLVSELMGRI